jgi:two-component system, LytTR family, response regulator
MTIDCIIVDDEPLSLDLIEGYVEKTPFLNLVGRCASAIEAIGVMNNKKVDLVFLDIHMPDLNGLEFSRTVKDETRIVFITAYEKYALNGYKVEALDYLIKPVNYEEFLTAANKAKKWFELVSQKSKGPEAEINSIYIKSEHRIIQVKLADVVYIEGLKDYVKIFLAGQTKPLMSLMSMKSLEEQLPSSDFMRVHRSFIVNLTKIKTIERDRIIFGDVYIPISDKYKDDFQEYLSKRFLKQT